jgi:hypothetical protein
MQGTFTCRRCNQKNLACYDITCDSDVRRLTERVNQLGYYPRANRCHPRTTGMLVAATAGLILVAAQLQLHPGGPFARQAKSLFGLTPQHTSIAHRENDKSM